MPPTPPDHQRARPGSTPAAPIGTPGRAELIEQHMPLVRALAWRFRHRGERYEDLVQVGAIGLIHATDRFAPERGGCFAAFAAPTIAGEIQRHLRDRVGVVRVPRRIQELRGALRRAERELGERLGRAPTIAELAAATGAAAEQVARALSAEAAAGAQRGARRQTLDGDWDADQRVARELATCEDRLALAGGFRALEERERQVVALRYYRELSQAEIARHVGISQAQVSRLLAGALAKLRRELDGLERAA